MNIYFIDWNNMTPQFSYPLIHSFINSKKFNFHFITNTKTKDEKTFSFYNINKIDGFITLNSFSFMIIFKPLILFLNYCILLKKINKSSPLILHFNWLSFPFIDLFFINIFKLFNIKIIITQHNYYQHSNKNLRFGEFSIFSFADKIICLSQFVKNQFDICFHKKITVIPHRNCYELLLKDKKKSNNKIISLLFVGNIKKYKGIELLVDVMSIFKSKNYPIHLNIIGSGNKNYINHINQKISSYNLQKMIFLNNHFIPFNNLCNHINMCDIGLLPYHRASQSGIPYLFSFYKKPIIINNVGGLCEQIDLDFCNISKPDVTKFYYNITNMIEKINTNKINPASYNKFLKTHSWDLSIKEYLLEYENQFKS